MYERLGELALASGEKVEVGAVKGPDLEWAGRIEKLLGHKGELWCWQISEGLRSDLGTDSWFYVLHRDETPFASICTAEVEGVGIFGHVFTRPEERGKGACSALMQIQMEHFRRRGGKALFLGTGYDSTAYRIYARHGFRSIEDRAGLMDYYVASRERFEAEYFRASDARIEPVNWRHWAVSPALYMGDFPGVVRCAPMRVIGRKSLEGGMIPVLRSERTRRAAGEPSRAMALCSTDTHALLGLTMWDADPLWPDTALLDIYCHPQFWDRADNLLAALLLPQGRRVIAYADAACPNKAQVLARAGFKVTATFRNRVAAPGAKDAFLDVTQFERAAIR